MAEEFVKLNVPQAAYLFDGVASANARRRNPRSRRQHQKFPGQRVRLARTVGDPCTGVYPEANSGANTFWIVILSGEYDPDTAGDLDVSWTDQQSISDPKHTAHNIESPGWVPEGTEIIVVHHSGQWWFARDGEDSGSPTTTTPNPGCTGTCQWSWSASDAAWSLSADTCATAAPTTTTASPITTTTAACSTTSTTSSTTTTTATPSCNCLYPTYCGTFDGEGTTTQCSEHDQDPNTSCPPTTTSTTSTTGGPTTTTCPPTTTTVPPQCSAGCDWVWAPVGWLKTSDSCNPVCACPDPPSSGDICDTYHTPCVIPPETTAPPPPTCGGTCDYWCPSVGGTWTQMSNDCVGGQAGCTCAAPSGPCDVCGPLQVSCITPGNTTTTTADPCDPTTPAPTTTTKGDCTDCKWKYDIDLDEWLVIEDNCQPSCSCQAPVGDGFIGGETAIVPCGEETTTTAGPTTTSTTTTSTTTTTSDPCENVACLLYNVNNFWQTYPSAPCDDPCECEGSGDQVEPGGGSTKWSLCAIPGTTTTCNPATDGATWTCGQVSLCPELPPAWVLTDNCCPGRVPDPPTGTCNCSTQDSPEAVSCGDPAGSTTGAPTTTTANPCSPTGCELLCVGGFYETEFGGECDASCFCVDNGEACTDGKLSTCITTTP